MLPAWMSVWTWSVSLVNGAGSPTFAARQLPPASVLRKRPPLKSARKSALDVPKSRAGLLGTPLPNFAQVAPPSVLRAIGPIGPEVIARIAPPAAASEPTVWLFISGPASSQLRPPSELL